MHDYWQVFERVANVAGFASFAVGLPLVIATYYQAYRARREAQQAMHPPILSENCVEFVLSDGTWINLVPLDSFHTLPTPGAILLLPGDAMGEGAGAYRVEALEYIYASEGPGARQPRQARLTKAIAQVRPVLQEIIFDERSGLDTPVIGNPKL